MNTPTRLDEMLLACSVNVRWSNAVRADCVLSVFHDSPTRCPCVFYEHAFGFMSDVFCIDASDARFVCASLKSMFYFLVAFEVEILIGSPALWNS